MDNELVYRLAKGVFFVAKGLGNVKETGEGLKNMAQALAAGDKDVAVFLNHPLVPQEKKRELLYAYTEDPTLRKLISILVAVKKTALMQEISAEFLKLEMSESQKAHAEVTLPWEATGDELKKIEETVRKFTGRDVETKVVVDPSIIGGILVKIGDTVIDNTVRAQLKQLEERLSA